MSDKKVPTKVFAIRKFTLKSGEMCKLGQEVSGSDNYKLYLLKSGLVSNKKPESK